MKKDIGNYIVHSDGTIISKKLKRPLKGWNMKGYVQVKMYGKAITVHRVVAINFIPNPENKPEVNHKDGNKKNNNVENLEWSTHSENIQHAYDNSMVKNLRRNFKLNIDDYDKIRMRRKSGEPYSKICKDFNINRSYAWFIINRKCEISHAE